MKQFTIPSYTFTPGASGVGTVNLSGISGFNVKYLVAVINQTRGVVIYSTGDTATRYTNLAGTTLTLNVDTSTHNSGDVLQVIYEVTAADPLTDTQLRASAVPVSGTFYQATQPVSASSLPLPSGASTLTEQQSQTTLLGTIDTDTGAIASSTSSIDSKTPALVSGRVPVDGSGVTQPVSIASSVAVTGPLTDAQLRDSAVPVSIGAMALPTGASTLAEQQAQTAKLDLIQADADETVNALEALRMAIQSLNRTIGQSMPDTAGRLRVLAENPTPANLTATVSLAASQTLASLSNQTQIGGLPATEQIPSLMRLGADSMRRNISVT